MMKKIVGLILFWLSIKEEEEGLRVNEQSQFSVSQD
jgi:hypothetical protein